MLSVCFLYGQTVSDTPDVDSTESTELNLTALSNNFEQNAFPSSVQLTENAESSKSSSMVWPVIRMILVLVLIVVAIYFLMKFFKKKGNVTKSDDDFMRRVSTLNIGPGKSVEIITIMDKGYMIGVTEGGINLISELDDSELVEALNLNFDKKNSTKKPYKFSDMLEMFSRGAEKKTVYGDAENILSDIVRRNSNREDL